MTDQRITGFVVGSDEHPKDHQKIWKVRVNQRGHPDNGEKLVVASTRNDIELADGVLVNFLIGLFGPDGNQKKAVDVMLASTQNQQN